MNTWLGQANQWLPKNRRADDPTVKGRTSSKQLYIQVPQSLTTPLQSAVDAAHQAGRILISYLGKATVREKGPSDLVTNADIAAQQAIQKILQARHPEFEFLGEESSADEQAASRSSGNPIWVVDPLDGTTNFVHRLPGFSVSIALVIEDSVKLGVIFDPTSGALYTATDDGPAMRDGQPIRVSGCQQLSQALVVCSFRPAVRRDDECIQQFLNVVEVCQSLRRFGSAAMNLCWLAEGCLDSYWASSVKCWDVAAGHLIAARAGAVFSQIDGSQFNLWNPKFLASASPQLHNQMLAQLKIETNIAS